MELSKLLLINKIYVSVAVDVLRNRLWNVWKMAQ